MFFVHMSGFIHIYMYDYNRYLTFLHPLGVIFQNFGFTKITKLFIYSNSIDTFPSTFVE